MRRKNIKKLCTLLIFTLIIFSSAKLQAKDNMITYSRNPETEPISIYRITSEVEPISIY